MHPNRRPVRRRRIALTSLIDVIFILLLFFMLTSTFTRFGEIRVSASAGGVVAADDTPPIFLRLSGHAVSVNGTPHEIQDVTVALATFAPEDGATAVLVSVSDEVTSQQLVDLLVALQPLEWANVAVLG